MATPYLFIGRNGAVIAENLSELLYGRLEMEDLGRATSRLPSAPKIVGVCMDQMAWDNMLRALQSSLTPGRLLRSTESGLQEADRLHWGAQVALTLQELYRKNQALTIHIIGPDFSELPDIREMLKHYGIIER
jgi:hypothetical protein